MRKLYIGIATLVLTIGAFAALLPARAQEAPAAGQGLEITPPLIQLDADPGDTTVVEIGLRNITEVDVITRGSVNDFVARDETGDPQILFDEEEESPYPLAAYISNVPDLRIAPTEQEIVRVTINVPEDASPGAHMGVIRFNAVPADETVDGSQVSLSASIGTLVLLNVSGDVEVALDVEELAVSRDGEVSGFFEDGPLTFITRLNNSGNVFVQPQGTLRLTNIFGQEVAVIPEPADGDEAEDETSAIEFNPTERNVLPNSIRRFEHTADKSLWFGRYTLTADLTYGPDEETVEHSVNFWVIPYKLVAIALLLLFAIGFFGRRALRAYKRNIIAQATSQSGQNPPQPPQQPPYAPPQ